MEVGLRVASASWIGLVRGRNEDAGSVNGDRIGALAEKPYARAHHFLLVADGMGGHAGGAVASDLAVRFFEDHARGLADLRSTLELIQKANRAIYEAVDCDPNLYGMGTTIAGVAVTANEILWFNVGDSRVYLHNQSGLHRLSVDHAIGSALTQCLGGSAYPQTLSPACGVQPWAPGDRILLCSDGLSGLLDDVELEQELRAQGENVRAVQDLLRLTSARGAPDNVTLVLATNGPDVLGSP